MQKTVSGAPRRRIFGALAALVASAGLAAVPAVTASAAPREVVGWTGNAVDGIRIAQGTERGSVPRLFELNTAAPGEQPVLEHVFCIDLRVGSAPGPLLEGTADEFAAAAADPKTNPRGREVGYVKQRHNVNAVLVNSYPNLPLEEFASAAQVAGLTEQEAIAAGQAAVWHFTDGFSPASAEAMQPDSEGPGANPAYQRAFTAYQYLVGIGENPQPDGDAAISIEQLDGYAYNQGDRTLGPIRINVAAPTAELVLNNAPAGSSVVRADGSPVADMAATPTGEELFVKFTDVPSSGVSIEAKADAQIGITQNRVFWHRDAPYLDRQSFLIAKVDRQTVSASLPLNWTPEQPLIGTTATDKADGDQFLSSEASQIVDRVSLTNLLQGVPYTLTGQLVDKATGQPIEADWARQLDVPVTDADIQAGYKDIVFDVPAGALMGKVVVAFEELKSNGTTVTTHHDINDEAQTIWSPAIRTTATGPEGAKEVAPGQDFVLTDKIEYQGLRPGVEYTVAGELRNADNGEPTGIMSTATFTPSEPNGAIEVVFQVPADVAAAGTRLVVFETLRQGDKVVAEHHDLNDAGQTVTVSTPPAGPPPSQTPPPGETVPPAPPAPSATETPGTPLPSPSPSAPGLAQTGGESGPTLTVGAIAAGLVLAGAVAFVARRRFSA
ncbi:MAG: VaFE repeat-containing surface-anchored protein [Pseudoclavibacter sp.]|nr:VaFE repeat-containing surface-anchored protein [Pseudoclavibacter sp.]